MRGTVIYRDLPWYYAELLDWHVEAGVVKAYPKKPLSDMAHKHVLRAFRRWGGHYVRHNGECWFEAALEPRQASTPVAEKIAKAWEELQK